MKELHALLPRFFCKVGHIFHYHVAVQKAVASIGWTYAAYIPQKTALSSLPEGWISVLANDTAEQPKGFWLKLQFFIKNIAPFRKIFRTMGNNPEAVVFIEHFELQHLASLAITLLFLKPRFQFWMLHRYELENRPLKAALLRLFLRFMRYKLGDNRIQCLTDSALLAQSLQQDLRCPVSVVPIPHTEGAPPSLPKNKTHRQFWWPGGLIREDKGLSKIVKLLELLNHRNDIRLVAAESAREAFASHPQIDFIPTSLPREEYVAWMQQADLILLPYSGKDYAKRTSGIFVEAISLGAIPVTTQGTWMAYELGRFALSDLALDWERPDLLDLLCHLLADPTIHDRLASLRAHYQAFHCLEEFAATLERIGV